MAVGNGESQCFVLERADSSQALFHSQYRVETCVDDATLSTYRSYHEPNRYDVEFPIFIGHCSLPFPGAFSLPQALYTSASCVSQSGLAVVDRGTFQAGLGKTHRA